MNVTRLGSMGDTNARSAHTCELSRAPAANALVLVVVTNTDAAGTVVEPTDVSGAGLTFVLINSSVTFNPLTVGLEVENCSLWRASGAAPTASMITATFPNTTTGCLLMIDEISGVTSRGANGVNQVGGSATTRGNNNVSSVTLFLPSAASTANAWYSFSAHGTTSAAVAQNNWIPLGSNGYLVPSCGASSAWTERSDATICVWTHGTTEAHGSVGVEIVADNFVAPVQGATTAAQWGRGHVVNIPRLFTPRERGDYIVETGSAINDDPATDSREV